MDIFLQILYTILVLSALILIHEFGHFIMAKRAKINVKEFSLGMGPVILKKQGKETLYCLRLFPIGGYVSMEGEDEESDSEGSFSQKSVGARISVVVAGAAMNLLLGFVITFCLVLSSKALPSTTVSQFREDAVSSSYGLQAGDKILKINGKSVNIYTDIAAAFSRSYNNDTVEMMVLRDGEKITLPEVKFPVMEAAEGLSVATFDFYVKPEDKNVITVAKHACFQTASYVNMMYDTIFDMVTGRVSLKYVSGPIGTSTVIADAAKSGVSDVFFLVALLSINLAVFNLLPLPALDGGRFLFLIIEAIRGKPVNPKYEGVVHVVGIVLLMGLMVVVAFKDIFTLVQ